jgi:hypothetical protein
MIVALAGRQINTFDATARRFPPGAEVIRWTAEHYSLEWLDLR